MSKTKNHPSYDAEDCKAQLIAILKHTGAWKGDNTEPKWDNLVTNIYVENPDQCRIGNIVAIYFAHHGFIPSCVICRKSDTFWLRNCVARAMCNYMPEKKKRQQDLGIITKDGDVIIVVEGKKLLYASIVLPTAEDMLDIEKSLNSQGATGVQFGSIWGPEKLQVTGKRFSILTY